MAGMPEQTKRSGLLVDSSLKAYGNDNIYAAGDCAVVYTGNAMLDDLGGLFAAADGDGNGVLDREELLSLFSQEPVTGKYPQAAVFADKIGENFDEIDADGSGGVDQDEFRRLLLDVDATMR